MFDATSHDIALFLFSHTLTPHSQSVATLISCILISVLKRISLIFFLAFTDSQDTPTRSSRQQGSAIDS